MRRVKGRLRVAVAVTMCVSISPLLGGTARANPVSSGYLQFSGYGGDYISQDQSWSYDPSDAALDATVSPAGNEIQLNVDGGTFWTLVLEAPQGQPLAPGQYDNATRWPFQSPDPGLSLFGDGRGCNTSTGSFTVIDAQFGPNGWIQRFDATFEQHCEGDPNSAAVGEVLIDNGPPPLELKQRTSVAATASVSRVTGAVVLKGSIICNKDATVNLDGTLTQRASRFVVVTGSWGVSSIPCSTTRTHWRAAVQSDSTVPFNPGKAQVDATSTGYDPDYQTNVVKTSSWIVKLVRS